MTVVSGLNLEDHRLLSLVSCETLRWNHKNESWRRRRPLYSNITSWACQSGQVILLEYNSINWSWPNYTSNTSRWSWKQPYIRGMLLLFSKILVLVPWPWFWNITIAKIHLLCLLFVCFLFDMRKIEILLIYIIIGWTFDHLIIVSTSNLHLFIESSVI